MRRRGGTPGGWRISIPTALLAAVMGAAASVAVAASLPVAAAPTVLPVYGTSQLTGIACMTSTSCIAVGPDGYVLVQNGTDGGVNTLPNIQLDAIACPTAAACFAVGSAFGSSQTGVVVPFVYGEQLSPIDVPGTGGLASIACTPATTSCVSVGNGYDPGPPGTFFATVVALANGNPTAAAQPVTALTGLQGVACPTATSCTAVGDVTQTSGGIVPITSGVAGAAVTPAGIFTMNTVACSSATTCWAGTSGGNGSIVPITSGVAGTPVSVSGAFAFYGASCPTATQCWFSGNISSGGGFVVPVTSGTVGTPTTDLPGSGNVADLACISASACLGVGFGPAGSRSDGVIITSAVPTPPPTISSVSFTGTGYSVTVTVKGTNFEPWRPEASPVTPVGCAPGTPSYDYAAGVLAFTDTTESWSAGTPGSCVGLVVKSWSNTSVTLGFGTGYVWPLLANGDAYQVSVVGATHSGTATVSAAAPPRITTVAVSGTGGSTAPTLTVTGTGLGTRVPLNSGSPGCTGGDTSLDFPNDEVFVSDRSQGWAGGETGDCLGLSVVTWKSTKVVLSFGPFYADVGSMQLGDSIEVGLLNATWSGLASTTPPPTLKTLTVTGTASAPTVTVTGSGLGSTAPAPDPSAPITCVAGDTSFTYPAGQLAFTDTTRSWAAGEVGDCIGLIVQSWTSTKVVLGLGADYPNFGPVTAGDSIQITVEGAVLTATAGV